MDKTIVTFYLYPKDRDKFKKLVPKKGNQADTFAAMLEAYKEKLNDTK